FRQHSAAGTVCAPFGTQSSSSPPPKCSAAQRSPTEVNRATHSSATMTTRRKVTDMIPRRNALDVNVERPALRSTGCDGRGCDETTYNGEAWEGSGRWCLASERRNRCLSQSARVDLAAAGKLQNPQCDKLDDGR